MVGVIGFEPTTPRPPGVCATGLRHTPRPSLEFWAIEASLTFRKITKRVISAFVRRFSESAPFRLESLKGLQGIL